MIKMNKVSAYFDLKGAKNSKQGKPVPEADIPENVAPQAGVSAT